MFCNTHIKCNDLGLRPWCYSLLIVVLGVATFLACCGIFYAVFLFGGSWESMLIEYQTCDQ